MTDPLWDNTKIEQAISSFEWNMYGDETHFALWANDAIAVMQEMRDAYERRDAQRTVLPDAYTLGELWQAAYEEWHERHDWRAEFSDVARLQIAELFRDKLARLHPAPQADRRDAGGGERT